MEPASNSFRGLKPALRRALFEFGVSTMSPPTVYLLWHSRNLREGETDDKLIGVYSTRAHAEAAISRKLTFEGFKDFPDDFLIEAHALDRDEWSEGFIVGE